jgi:hypothetical protein
LTFPTWTCNYKLSVKGKKIMLIFKLGWRAPNSLKDSNVSPKCKQWKNKESRHVLWLASFWKGRRACWSFGVGQKRIDKLHLFTQTYTQQNEGGQYIVRTLLALRRVTGNSDTQDSPWPRLGEATTFPFIVYSMPPHRRHIQMTFCLGISKWESQNSHGLDSLVFGSP